MIAENSNGFWDASCDVCNEPTRNIEAPSFKHVVSKLLRWDWRVRQITGTKFWEHTCPLCLEKENSGTVNHNGW